MTKLKWLFVFALGYVAGAAAGRQRYEQIKAAAQKFAGDPRVQSAAQKASDTVAEKAPVVAEAIKDKGTAAASTVASTVGDKLHHSDSSSSDDAPAATVTPAAPPTGGPALS